MKNGVRKRMPTADTARSIDRFQIGKRTPPISESLSIETALSVGMLLPDSRVIAIAAVVSAVSLRGPVRIPIVQNRSQNSCAIAGKTAGRGESGILMGLMRPDHQNHRIG